MASRNDAEEVVVIDSSMPEHEWRWFVADGIVALLRPGFLKEDIPGSWSVAFPRVGNWPLFTPEQVQELGRLTRMVMLGQDLRAAE